jgi:hypothetical protein
MYYLHFTKIYLCYIKFISIESSNKELSFIIYNIYLKSQNNCSELFEKFMMQQPA